MITEGYGRTLGRAGLDLMRRELCTVAQTAVLETPRQLHSHLRGALNAGATFGQIEGVLSIVNPLLSFDQWKKVKELWRTVREGLVAGALMLIDRAVVRVVGGTGGSGASSFARFKYKPKGGPDGGDGGHGGQRLRQGDANLATLLDYRYRTTWKAERGEHGKGKTKTGASADDIYLPVPPGTVVRDADTGELARRNSRGRRHGAGGARWARRAGQRAVRHAHPPGPPRVGARRGRRGPADRAGAQAHRGRRPGRRAQRGEEHAALGRSRRRGPRSPTIRSPRSSRTSAWSALSGHRSFVVADIPGIIEGAHRGQGARAPVPAARRAYPGPGVSGPARQPGSAGDLRASPHEVAQYSEALAQKEHVVAHQA